MRSVVLLSFMSVGAVLLVMAGAIERHNRVEKPPSVAIPITIDDAPIVMTSVMTPVDEVYNHASYWRPISDNLP